MKTNVKPIPEGFHHVTPFLIVEGAEEVIDFMKETFDAVENYRVSTPDGGVMHAELKIGDSIVMLGEACCGMKPAPGALYVYVEDPDATYRRALDAGATSLNEPADQFYGDRQAGVKDPAGNIWWVARRIEILSPAELTRRAREFMEQRKDLVGVAHEE